MCFTKGKYRWLVALFGLGWLNGATAHGIHHAVLTPEQQKISQGWFNDAQVKPRSLKDWDGVWQSVAPYLADGTLEPVLQAKAAKQGKSVSEIRQYYQQGYQTPVTQIDIENDLVTFHKGTKHVSCRYQSAGYKILSYPAGNRGVRYLFTCTDKRSAAPRFIQFSDHLIAPQASAHFHIYTGDQSQEALLSELHHWPTYYPYQLTGPQISEEMMAH